MNEKGYRDFIIVIVIFTIVFVFTGAIFCYYIGRADTGDNKGIESNISRERELLERIGEYEYGERERITRENNRIERERERIKQTENAIRAIRNSDRRSGSLLEELEQEINVLAGYFRDSRDGLYNELNNTGSE
jgi:hypothetical protein